MEFVEVMGIAKRYKASHCISELPHWFSWIFNLDVSCHTKEALEEAERELLAWAEQHPEQTETKEDKTMKKRTDRVCEILGVEEGEHFTCKTYPNDLILSVCQGVLYRTDKVTGTTEAGSSLMCEIINDPSLIIRLPRYTPEQVKTMRALVVLGMTHVVIDSEGYMFACDEEPRKDAKTWLVSPMMDTMHCKSLDVLQPAMKDWTVPLDLLAALKDAGEVTSNA